MFSLGIQYTFSSHIFHFFIFFFHLLSFIFIFQALSDFNLAGDDFETAKQLKSGDPNFSLEYKTIAQCEYMEFTTEPDLIEPFPQLLLEDGCM